jgi:hypothetical protein
MQSQVPPTGTLNLDHVAHFVPHIEAASTGLDQLGFTLTPFSAQSHRLEPGGPLVPAGTGNRCVMLKQGYLEFLTPIADTPLANQLRTAMKRYVGVHLIAFGTASPDIDHGRLSKAGFEPLAPVALQRGVDTVSGTDIARFTVVRVPPGAMAEGRIQFCQHHTPELLWRPRWLDHANGARALRGVLLCVEDPQQTALRYARFTGLRPRAGRGGWRLDTAHGFLMFLDAEHCQSNFSLQPPALPWIAGYVLASDSVAATCTRLLAGGCTVRAFRDERWLVELPPEIGGFILFESTCSAPLVLD